MGSEQEALTLLTVVHADDDPPDAWGDWYERDVRRMVCRTCRARPTRGRYCEETDGRRTSEPMCAGCWVRLTRIAVEVEQVAVTPLDGGAA